MLLKEFREIYKGYKEYSDKIEELLKEDEESIRKKTEEELSRLKRDLKELLKAVERFSKEIKGWLRKWNKAEEENEKEKSGKTAEVEDVKSAEESQEAVAKETKEEGDSRSPEIVESAEPVEEKKEEPESLAKEASQEIDELPPQKKKGWLNGLAELGFKTQEIKCRTMREIISQIKKSTRSDQLGENGELKKGSFLNKFLNSYENIYSEDLDNARKKREMENKGLFLKTSGLLQGAGNVFKYGRVAYDFASHLSLKGLNPLRHITAAAMFIGKTAEAGKETRFTYKTVREKTLVEDEERAIEEAWDLYEKAESKYGKTNGEALSKAYKENLPKDLLDRLCRVDYSGIKFFKHIFEADLLITIGSLNDKLEKIESNGKLSNEKKEAKKQNVLARYDKFLKDLDRMVGDQGFVDNIAYTTRLMERTGKNIANLLVIDSARIAAESIYRVCRNMPAIWDSFQNYLEGEGEKYEAKKIELALKGGADGEANKVAGKTKEAVESEKGKSAAESSEPKVSPAPETSNKVVDYKKDKEAQPHVPYQVSYQGGKSVWRESEKQLAARFKERFEEYKIGDPKVAQALKIYDIDRLKRVIVANPEKYGLPEDVNWNKMSKEQIKGIKWDEAFKKAFPDNRPVDGLRQDQIDNILKGGGRREGVDKIIRDLHSQQLSDMNKKIQVGEIADSLRQYDVNTNLGEEIMKGAGIDSEKLDFWQKNTDYFPSGNPKQIMNFFGLTKEAGVGYNRQETLAAFRNIPEELLKSGNKEMAVNYLKALAGDSAQRQIGFSNLFGLERRGIELINRQDGSMMLTYRYGKNFRGSLDILIANNKIGIDGPGEKMDWGVEQDWLGAKRPVMNFNKENLQAARGVIKKMISEAEDVKQGLGRHSRW